MIQPVPSVRPTARPDRPSFLIAATSHSPTASSDGSPIDPAPKSTTHVSASVSNSNRQIPAPLTKNTPAPSREMAGENG